MNRDISAPTTAEDLAALLAAQSAALAGSAPCPPWLAGFRAAARSELDLAPFPGRHSERWKYTRLNALAASGALAAHAGVSHEAVPSRALPPIDAWRIVFVNGRYDAAQSQLPADGSLLVSALTALPQDEHADAATRLDREHHAHPFAALNAAAFADGIYVRVKSGTRVSRPLHAVFHATGQVPATTQARLSLRLDAQSELALVEQYTGDAADILTNAVTRIELERDAKLALVRLELGGHAQWQVGALDIRLAANSRCEAFLLQSGRRLLRNDIACHVDGEGAELAIRGAYLVGRDEHVDNQVRIEHRVPGGASNQVYRGITGGNGRAVLNGRIHIHPGARRTRAELVNNNLLLSADAEVDTKPELEIYNDDVVCSHGATVGQLNEAGVYYLQSRGIAKEDAELMLSLGFINALVDQVPVDGLAQWLRDTFARAFADRAARGLRA